MAEINNSVAYGLQNPLQKLAPRPIASNRNPTVNDRADAGTVWANRDGNDAFICTGTVNNQTQWIGSGGGAGDFTSLTVSPGRFVVDSTDTNAISVQIEAVGAIVLDSTLNDLAISLSATGGAASKLWLSVPNSTDADAIHLAAPEGGITVASGKATAIEVTDAGEDLNLFSTLGSVNLSGGEASPTAVNITASNLAGGVLINTGTGGILVNSAGAVNVQSGTAACNFGVQATNHITTVGSTTAGCTLVLNTPTGTNVAAANGISITTAGRGVSLPGGVLVLAGAGDPNTVVTAPIGSLFTRTDPAGATSRLYVNTNAGTAWANFTASA